MEEINIISKVTNEIIIDILINKTNSFIEKLDFDEDIINLIQHIPDELENSYGLCLRGNIVSSMILLRSIYENMLFIMNTMYNSDIITEYKKINNNIRPAQLKDEIIENWDKYFSDIMENQKQTEIEIKNIYNLLSKFIHPNCIRTTTSMIEKDKEKAEIMKYLYMQNITSIILMYIDFINKFLHIKDNLIYSFYLIELICIMLYIQVNKDKVLELQKYNEYMYININENEIDNYSNIINKEINEISEINNNSWKKAIENLQEDIKCSKYNQKVRELNGAVVNLTKKLNTI